MKTFNVIIGSKSKNVMNNFIMFFNSYLVYNSNISLKYFQKKITKKRMSLLKSPHVNKKSQEQFENKLFKKHFTITVPKTFKYLVVFKKVTLSIFPNLRTNLKQTLINKNKLNLNVFNINNFKIGLQINKKTFTTNFKLKKSFNLLEKKCVSKCIEKTKQLVVLLDLYGEFLK